MNSAIVEVVGYIGSGLVILSLLQKSILRLRTIGLVASLTFLIYSVSIEAYPIAVVNVVAASIHLYYLRKQRLDQPGAVVDWQLGDVSIY